MSETDSDKSNEPSTSVEKKTNSKGKVRRKSIFNRSYKVTKLRSVEKNLKKIITAVYKEMDLLDVEWLQLCNVTNSSTSETAENIDNSTSQVVELDDVEMINAVKLDLSVNMNKFIRKQEEEFDSDDET